MAEPVRLIRGGRDERPHANEAEGLDPVECLLDGRLHGRLAASSRLPAFNTRDLKHW